MKRNVDAPATRGVPEGYYYAIDSLPAPRALLGGFFLFVEAPFSGLYTVKAALPTIQIS
jgi:hypothetical protein